MRGWMSIAYLAKPKNLNGGLVARGASGLPFALRPGLTLAVVRLGWTRPHAHRGG